jgi:hypothetical protein
MVEIIPQADALGVMNTAELWSLLVDAADVWTRYRDARRDLGRQLAVLGVRPPWSSSYRGREPGRSGQGEGHRGQGRQVLGLWHFGFGLCACVLDTGYPGRIRGLTRAHRTPYQGAPLPARMLTGR